MRIRLLLILALMLSTASAAVSACTVIGSAPYTISTPGAYCLDGDLIVDITQDKPGILIAADSVELDLRGFSISAQPSGNGLVSYGVYAKAQYRIRVHNGQIHGFYFGIALTDDVSPTIGFVGLSHGHEVSDLKITDSGIGIFLVGRDSTLSRNVIVNSRYSGIRYHGNALGASNPDIRLGAGLIDRNEIHMVTAPAGFTDPVYGIGTSGHKSLIEGNWIARIIGPTGSSAILIVGDHSIALDNQQSDLSSAHGVLCTSPSNIAINNLADVPGAVVGCTIQ